MQKGQISDLLLDYYNMLVNYLEGQCVKKVLDCTETHIALLMNNGTIIKFIHLEDELIFDIELPG